MTLKTRWENIKDLLVGGCWHKWEFVAELDFDGLFPSRDIRKCSRCKKSQLNLNLPWGDGGWSECDKDGNIKGYR